MSFARQLRYLNGYIAVLYAHLDALLSVKITPILWKVICDTLLNPFGLDIGAETPEEIALSIVAEIKAVLAGKPGRPLREKVAGIHD